MPHLSTARHGHYNQRPATESATQQMKNKVLLYLAALLLAAVYNNIHAATLTINNPPDTSIHLQQWLEYYNPGLQKPGINDILQLSDAQWRPLNKNSSLSETMEPRRTLWYRMRISNPFAAIDLALINTNPMTDSLQAFLDTGKEIEAIQRKTPGIEGAHTALFTVPGNSESTLYISTTGFHSASVPLSLNTLPHMMKEQHKHELRFGIIDGIIIGLMIYNTLLWQKTRQQEFFSYMMLGFFNILSISIHQNIFTTNLSILTPEWRTNLSTLSYLVVSLCLTNFLQTFLQTRQRKPQIHRLLNYYILLTITMIALFLAHCPLIITTSIFMAGNIVMTILVTIVTMRDVDLKPATRAFLTSGYWMPIATILITAMAASGSPWLEKEYTTLVQGTYVIEMFMLSLAMVSRINQMQEEHESQAEAAEREQITNQAHNKLLAHLNHEFRTPLNAILGASELLINNSNRREMDVLTMIHNTAVPLKHLIDDMVNINAINQNRKQIQSIRFDLQKLLQECMDLFIPTAKNKNIRLSFDIEQSLATDVSGDPNRLRQILLNLLGNAIKFSPDGEVFVYACNEVYGSVHSIYRFEVHDNSSGIAPEDRQRIFLSYEQGNSPSESPGSGLGLSIVQELSTLLGGESGYTYKETIPTDKPTSIFWFTARLDTHTHVTRKIHSVFADKRILLADRGTLLATHIQAQLMQKAQCAMHASTPEALLALIHQTSFDTALVHHEFLDDIFDHAIFEHIPQVVIYFDQTEDRPHDHPSNHAYPVIHRPSSIESFLQLAANAILKSAPVSSKEEDEPKRVFPSLSVLVAEDIPESQLIIKAVLQDLGHNVDLCKNGKEARDKCQQQFQRGHKYDLIFMDCEMPMMDGFSASREIRLLEQQYNMYPTPIAALTAHTEPSYRFRSQQAGMNAYLTKPISREAIENCISQLKIPAQ